MNVDAFKKEIDRAAAKSDRKRARCGNCTWFVGNRDEPGSTGTCFRYPPAISAAEGDRDSNRPTVAREAICGEFMHMTSGDTFYGEIHRFAALRGRFGELEDEIERMKARQA